MDLVTSAAGGFAGAFVVGASSSVHCFFMCGPLACVGASSREGRSAAAAGYHGARIAAYTAVGAAAGALGGSAGKLLDLPLRPALPWVLAATLLLTALGVGKRVGRIPGVSRITSAVAARAARLSPTLRGGAMGALTPLLPCGLLYGIVAAAIAAGSTGGGASVMAGFALGATPALALAQIQAKAAQRLPPTVSLFIRRGVPLLAAGVLVYRAVVNTDAGGTSCH